MKLDMERIYIEHPEFYGQEMIDRHFARYEWVLQHLKPTDIVLDAACGSGYGTNMFAKKCRVAIGVDNNADAINYAVKHKANILTFFIKCDMKTLDIGRQADAVASIETIEHFTEEDACIVMDSFFKILGPNGKLFITTPNANESKDNNPYHLKEYSPIMLHQFLSHWFEVTSLEMRDGFIYAVAEKRAYVNN